MATLDQLSADQRAIVELLLQRGKSYDELAELLGMNEDRVRELAREALLTLTPVTAGQVESDWRGQLADYVLGQQTGPEATATKGHLRRSEAARAWTRSLLDSLEALYENGLPQVPAGERAIRERKPRQTDREEGAAAPSRLALSPAAREAVRRRRMLAGGGAAIALLLVIVLLWPIGVLTGSSDNGKKSSNSSAPAAQTGRTAGIAVIAQRGSQRQVIVQATLPPNRQREAYEVWLYNSRTDAKSLGAQVTNAQGGYQGAGPLPNDYARFRYIDISREPIDRNRAHSGVSVLRGTLPRLKTPSASKKNQAQILGQVVLRPVGG